MAMAKLRKIGTVKELPPGLATSSGGDPPFEDYNKIFVPITQMRMELSQFQKDGFDTIPLGELLRLIARVIKEK